MLNQTRILVIDDEKFIRDGCARILSKDGCFVIPAENGEAGLAELDKAPEEIDVILLDLMMPGMSGIEVLEKIQALDRTFVVIVITGYASVGNAVEATEKGAYDFIAKPFTPKQLSVVVKKALEWRTQKKLGKERERSLQGVAMGESRVKTIRIPESPSPGHCMYYHQGHSWAIPENDDVVRVGIDDFAQKLVGKIDAITFPEVGSQVSQGEKGWSLLAGAKSIDMLSPVDGKVVEINERLLSSPESIGKDPYGQSWLMKVQAPKISANLKNLLSGGLAGKWMEGVRENLLRPDELQPGCGIPGRRYSG